MNPLCHTLPLLPSAFCPLLYKLDALFSREINTSESVQWLFLMWSICFKMWKTAGRFIGRAKTCLLDGFYFLGLTVGWKSFISGGTRVPHVHDVGTHIFTFHYLLFRQFQRAFSGILNVFKFTGVIGCPYQLRSPFSFFFFMATDTYQTRINALAQNPE